MMWVLGLLGSILVMLIKLLFALIGMLIVIPLILIASIICAVVAGYISYWLIAGVFYTIQFFTRKKAERTEFKAQIWEFLYALDLDRTANKIGQWLQRAGEALQKQRTTYQTTEV